MIDTPEIYVGLALVILVLTLFLLRWNPATTDREAKQESLAESLVWNVDSLQVATRIFDPTDFSWLRDEKEAPALAQELECARKNLAMRWLSMVGESFRELSREIRESPERTVRHSFTDEFILLRHIVFFYVLINLTKLTVMLFGPYTKLTVLFRPARHLQLLQKHFPSVSASVSSPRGASA